MWECTKCGARAGAPSKLECKCYADCVFVKHSEVEEGEWKRVGFMRCA